MKPKLSVVLATYNEEANLAGCLQSVKNLANEIIVVDGSSTDNTVAIAKKFKAKVFSVPNLPMFHTNKQKAVAKASLPWILQLDADEHVTPELATEIKEIMDNDQAHDGYYLPRKNFFLTRFLTKGGQYPDHVIRLFKNGKGSFPQKSVHEQIAIKGSLGYCSHPLLHYSDPTFSRYLSRFNRYTSLEASKTNSANLFSYCLVKPIHWFLLTYFRHKGFMDGMPGLIFSLMSSLRFPVTYLKYMELKHARRH